MRFPLRMAHVAIFVVLAAFASSHAFAEGRVDEPSTNMGAPALKMSLSLHDVGSKAVEPQPVAKLKSPAWPAFGPQTPVIDEAGFLTLAKSGRVLDAIVQQQTLSNSEIFLRLDSGAAWRLEVPSLRVPIFMSVLAQNKIKMSVVTSMAYNQAASHMGQSWLSVLWDSLPIGQLVGQFIFLIVLVIVMVWVQIKAGKMMTGKRVRAVKPRDIKTSFDDVAGIDEAVRDMREAVAFLNKPESFTRLGATLPKGILLVGPPGGGKTMLAKAFAKASDAPFYSVSGSEFVELYVGTGAARIRSLFKKARRSGKAVIFIDEIDALAKARGGIGGHSEAEQTLNQLLVEMDGLAPTKSQIIVIGATNRVDAMDEAVLRPGRFDRQVYVSSPSLKGREDILRVYLKNELAKGQDLGIAHLARICPGFSGAQLANLVNEARIRAAREGHQALTSEHLLSARDKILLGDPRKDLDMTEAELRNTAIHEAGHAVVAHLVSKDPVEKVTIEPRSRALGLMLQVPERDAVSLAESEAHAKIKVLMAGRAAEEVFHGDVTTGASNDMERAFSMALRMVSQWGYGTAMGKNGVANIQQLSPGLREAVEMEARDVVNAAYESALTLVRTHKDAVLAVSASLMQQETIDRAEFLRAVQSAPSINAALLA